MWTQLIRCLLVRRISTGAVDPEVVRVEGLPDPGLQLRGHCLVLWIIQLRIKRQLEDENFVYFEISKVESMTSYFLSFNFFSVCLSVPLGLFHCLSLSGSMSVSLSLALCLPSLFLCLSLSFSLNVSPLSHPLFLSLSQTQAHTTSVIYISSIPLRTFSFFTGVGTQL